MKNGYHIIGMLVGKCAFDDWSSNYPPRGHPCWDYPYTIITRVTPTRFVSVAAAMCDAGNPNIGLRQ